MSILPPFQIQTRRPQIPDWDVRTPQACNSCRQRKVKCSGEKPSCRGCLRRKLVCAWPAALIRGNYASAELEPLSSTSNIQSPSHSVLISESISGVTWPEPALLNRSFDIFFARHHDVELCSFMHKPTLDISALRNRSPFLVASIISLASLYISTIDASQLFGFSSGYVLSEHYAQIARAYARELSDKPSVSSIQGYMVLALRELIAWASFKAWMYTGISIRMAQALRLGSEFNSRFSPRLKEIRRRTFWATFTMDRLVSFCCARAPMISLHYVRIQLPCPDSTFIFEEEYSGPWLQSINENTNQLSRLEVGPVFVKAVSLWGDMAMLHMSGGRRKIIHLPTDPLGEFYQKNNAVDEFVSRLPKNLLWSPQNYKRYTATTHAQTFVNIHFMLCHAKCVMHQEYLPQLDMQNFVADGAIDNMLFDNAGLSLDFYDEVLTLECIKNANMIVDMATLLFNGTDGDQKVLQSTFAANAMISAAGVQLWVQYAQTYKLCQAEEAKARADILLKIIGSWRAKWKVAVAWTETLEMLYMFYNYSYGAGDASTLAFWESGQDEARLPLTEEIDTEEGTHRGLVEGDGMPDPSATCQRMFDKVITIMRTPLEATEVKQRMGREYLNTLWKHMWIHFPVEDMTTVDSMDDLDFLDEDESAMPDPSLHGEV